MTPPRAEALIAKLEKGRQKTLEAFNALTPSQWEKQVYTRPNWSTQHLLAHFVSSEKQLLALAQDVAGGGAGAPPEFDIDRHNAAEQSRLEGQAPQTLLHSFDQARQQTIEWVRTLDVDQLDKIGRHPALGEVTVEAMIMAMHGHQLIHIRDLSRIGKTNAPEASA
jgi:hypothetical protein